MLRTEVLVQIPPTNTTAALRYGPHIPLRILHGVGRERVMKLLLLLQTPVTLVKLHLVAELDLIGVASQVHVTMEPLHTGSERDGVHEKDSVLPENEEMVRVRYW